VCRGFAADQHLVAEEASAEILAFEIDAQSTREAQSTAETPDEALAFAEQLEGVLAQISAAAQRRKLAEATARGLDEPHTHPRYWCAQHRPEA
jgi:hypothetical protein